jgi:hypothetical protein
MLIYLCELNNIFFFKLKNNEFLFYQYNERFEASLPMKFALLIPMFHEYEY